MKALATMVLILILATAGYAAEEKLKSQYKLFRFNAFEIGITCLNGGDPAYKHLAGGVNGILVVSCGNNVNR
jgi:hypothetical protein